MRLTGKSPELRAMPVALEDQGETVPSRGTTRKTLLPSSSPGGGLPSSSSARSVRDSCASSARSSRRVPLFGGTRARLVRFQRALEFHQIAVLGAEGAQARVDLLQGGEQLGESELRQGARPAKLKDFRH